MAGTQPSLETARRRHGPTRRAVIRACGRLAAATLLSATALTPALAAHPGDGAAQAAEATSAALLPASTPRIAGPDRYTTAAKIAQAAFPAGAETAIIVNGEPGHYADALASNYLAGQLGAPVLLATATGVPPATTAELAALHTRAVWLVGGSGVLTAAVRTELEADGITVARQLGGATRYDTDAAVVQAATGPVGVWQDRATAIVTRGDDFPDALAAGPLAYARHFPVIVTTPTTLTAQAAATLRAAGIQQVITVGGDSAVSPTTIAAIEALGITVASPARGTDRADTATLLAEWELANAGFGTASVALGSGEAGHEVDALAAGPYAGSRTEPLLVTDSADIAGNAAAFPAAHPEVASVDVTGGTAAVSDDAAAAVASHTFAPVAPCRPAERAAGWVAAENRKAGDSGWSKNVTGGIAGYASQVSATCGDKVVLYVNTAAATFTVKAYRMGYYGGARARLVWTSTPQRGRLQPAATVDSVTHEVIAPWTASATVRITTSWPAGDYLLKLVDSDGHASFVPLVVRDDASSAALLVQNAVATYQVYNTWGGYSGYFGPDNRSDERALVVSFDRPYVFDGSHQLGDGSFLLHEYPFVEWAEQHGYDLAYTSDVDLNAHPSVVGRHKALIELGHTEYWSDAMRSAVVTAAARGVNVAWLGANDLYWRIRFAASRTGADRAIVIHRTLDAMPPDDRTAERATVRWRDAPVSAPEQELEGVMYDCLGVSGAMTVTDPTAWVWQNTGVTAGTELAGLLYGETDRWFAGNGPDVELFAHSPLSCPAHNEPQTWADMAYHTDPRTGAGVIAVGTMAWINRLEPPLMSYGYSLASTRAVVQRATANILDVFSRGPAGAITAAHPDTAQYYNAVTGPGTPDGSPAGDASVDDDDG